VYYALTHADPQYPLARALVEFLVDHEVIQRILDRKGEGEKREWIKTRLRDRRREAPQTTWEDMEAEWEREHPRELTPVEQLHAAFSAAVPHPELHGGKKAKAIWATIEEEQLGFMDFVEREGLHMEEGNLFSYLARVMRVAKMLGEATGLDEFRTVEAGVRRLLGAVDERVLSE
jgi:hypothetical protein